MCYHGNTSSQGWGKKRHGMDKSSDELLEVDVPVWTQDVCRKLEAPYSFNGETQICAGPKEGGEGFCQVSESYLKKKVF